MTTRNRIVAAAVLSILGSVSVGSALASESYDFNLPEQPLADSLREIGRRATMNILFDAGTVKEMRAPAIEETMSAQEALEKALAGTGLVIQEMNTNSVLVGSKNSARALMTSWSGRKIRLAAAAVEPRQTSAPAVLEEVTVTAQRREENSQSVPIAITAVSGEDATLRGAVSVETLSNTVPSLVTTGSSGTSIFIRGVGNTSASPNNEPSAAMYIDGVYMPSITGLIGFPLNNIERFEVLKGPQGTLFGRNSTAGVVQIITPDPRHELGGHMSLGYGNYETVSANAYLTGGFTDNLAADLAVLYEDQMDGWGHNLNTGTDIYRHQNVAARSKWVYTPSDLTKLTTAFDFERYWYSSGTQLSENSFAIDDLTTYPGRFNAFGDLNADTHHQYGASLRVDHDFDSVHGVSISSYRNVKAHIILDNDRTPTFFAHVDQFNDADYVSQEFQLSNRNAGRITWVAGAFLYGNTVNGANPRTDTGTNIKPGEYRNTYGTQKTRSYSGYGQVTAEIVANTKLTLGLRYTDENLKAYGRREDIAGQVISGPFDDEVSFNPWTWRVALDHQFTPDVLGYVSYNRGFKSGGYNLNSPGTIPFYPETLDAYETGLKSELLDHRVRLNLAAFYYEYKNLQVAIVPGGVGQIFTNAAAARNYGLDASLDFAATDYLTLSGGVSLLNAKYADYPDAQGYTMMGVPFPVANAKGNYLPYSPKFSGYVSANYRVPTPIGSFKGSTSLSYNDKTYITADNSFAHPSRFLLNTSVEWWSQADRPFGVRLWARNLTNTYYFTNRIESTGGWYQIAASPRTYGLTLLKDF